MPYLIHLKKKNMKKLLIPCDTLEPPFQTQCNEWKDL